MAVTLSAAAAVSAVRLERDGVLVGVASVAVADGRVTRVYAIANPDKLGRLDAVAELSRHS